ncbi:hypothetical protein [Microvirga terricola]|uniref:hypothetical protein n=1 Tax=Microvirga terricola TaxID=2719797 RepID=UPI00197B0C97|nr:hypothetical protein [Microvirga terricola]
MSSLVNIVLFIALVTTSICVLGMYQKLKRLNAYHAEYRRTADQTAEALRLAGISLNSFATDGRDVLGALDTRISEARDLLIALQDAARTPGWEPLPPAATSAAPRTTDGQIPS